MGRLTLAFLFSLTGCASSLGSPVATPDGVQCFDGERRTDGVAVCEARVVIEDVGGGRSCGISVPRVDAGRPLVPCDDGSFGFCAVVPARLSDPCIAYLEACPPGARCEVPFDPTNGELGELVIVP